MAKRPQKQGRPWRESLTQPLADTPWYVRAIAFIGMPSAVAGLLLWFFINLYSSFVIRFEAIELELRNHAKATDALMLHLKSEEEALWQLVSISQRNCLNTAKSDSDRLGCVVARVQK